MRRRVTSGAGARALQEFALALRSGPFRVALVLSLLAHLVLLGLVGWGRPERGAGRKIPLMRVRLLPPSPLPEAAPVAPAGNPGTDRR